MMYIAHWLAEPERSLRRDVVGKVPPPVLLLLVVVASDCRYCCCLFGNGRQWRWYCTLISFFICLFINSDVNQFDDAIDQ
jgi:hypothetical protein